MCSDTDALRYFLLREIVFGQDGSFSFDALVQRYNADLANGLGNLASRTLTMITRYFKGEVPYPSRAAIACRTRAPSPTLRVRPSLNSMRFSSNASFRGRWKRHGAWLQQSTSTSLRMSLGHWARKQDEESRARLATVLYTSAEALRIVTALAHPVIPEATAKIWTQLGLGDIRKFPLCRIASGDSSTWARSWERFSRSFRAPTRARSKGCSRWKSKDALPQQP